MFMCRKLRRTVRKNIPAKIVFPVSSVLMIGVVSVGKPWIQMMIDHVPVWIAIAFPKGNDLSGTMENTLTIQGFPPYLYDHET